MPIIRKLTEQEVQTLERKGKGQRQIVEEQYDAFLEGYAPGDYGEAELDEGEKRLTVRNRFKAAAARRGLELVFQPTRGNVMRFRIVATEGTPEVEAELTVASDAEPKRGGRRKVGTS